jgi:hypothetical protein
MSFKPEVQVANESTWSGDALRIASRCARWWRSTKTRD